MTLAEFLAARLDETAERAWAVHDVAECDALAYAENMGEEAARRDPGCDCGWPEQARRDVTAKRGILAAYVNSAEGSLGRDYLGFAVATLARAWIGHPDYSENLP